MIDKRVATLAEAVADVPDGATVMIGGFGTAGLPTARSSMRSSSDMGRGAAPCAARGSGTISARSTIRVARPWRETGATGKATGTVSMIGLVGAGCGWLP